MAKSHEGMTDGKPRRLQWRDEDMRKALEAVSSKELTVSAAARVYQVPRKTLDDRLKGHVVNGHKPGPKTILSSMEEETHSLSISYTWLNVVFC